MPMLSSYARAPKRLKIALYQLLKIALFGVDGTISDATYNYIKCAFHLAKLDQVSKYAEEQAGFRKERGTIDQIFTLQAMIQKYLSKPGRKFYCAFIDFSKALTVYHTSNFILSYIVRKSTVT